jgi:hypothetical protein
LFSLNFLSTVKYLYGGKFYRRLEQGPANYYEIFSTDGYGLGSVSKVVNWEVVASTSVQSSYVQDTNYLIDVPFSSTGIQVQIFGPDNGVSSDTSANGLSRMPSFLIIYT